MTLDEGGECDIILDERYSNERRSQGNFEKFYQELDFV